MTKSFIQKVLAAGSIDTNRYRYVTRTVTYYDYSEDRYVRGTDIMRLPVEELDTTGALSDWHVVYSEREYNL